VVVEGFAADDNVMLRQCQQWLEFVNCATHFEDPDLSPPTCFGSLSLPKAS
jgi:hypothetical protein